jgi:hypothetical protein
VFDLLRQEVFARARREGRREPAEAYEFDTLIELALRHGTRRAPGTNGSDGTTAGGSDGAPGDTGNGSTDVPPVPTTAGPAPASPAASPGSPTAGNRAGAPEPTPAKADPTVGQLRLVDQPGPPADAPAARPVGRPVDPTHLALLRVDLQALVRGHVEGGELCEIAGVGPLSVAAARELLGESVLRLVITRGVDVLNVTNLGRGPTAAQEIAFLWASPACTVLGCDRRHGQSIQHDHRQPWTETHQTATGNIDRLCAHHHALKTRFGWALMPGTGKRPMVPPDDPRHPKNQPGRDSKPTGERSPPPDQTGHVDDTGNAA